MAKSLFHSCRSPSAAAAITPKTTLLAGDQQRHVVPAPPGAACCPRGVPRRRSQRPAACGGAADNCDGDDLALARGAPAYRWLKSSRWHVIEANAYATTGAADDGEDAPRLKIDARRRVRRRSLRRRRRALHHRRAAAPASWSSDDSGWFSTDDEDRQPYAESATLVTTSSTTTTESSSTGTGANGNIAPGAGATREEEVVEQRPVAVAGGFAVVKRSEDPRADFRRSMAEMVVGRGIYDADGLERLLRCFLALNDQRHRRDIVAAFGDVWEAVFANPPACDAQPNSGNDAESSRAAPSSAKAAGTVRQPINVINS